MVLDSPLGILRARYYYHFNIGKAEFLYVLHSTDVRHENKTIKFKAISEFSLCLYVGLVWNILFRPSDEFEMFMLHNVSFQFRNESCL